MKKLTVKFCYDIDSPSQEVYLVKLQDAIDFFKSLEQEKIGFGHGAQWSVTSTCQINVSDVVDFLNIYNEHTGEDYLTINKESVYCKMPVTCTKNFYPDGLEKHHGWVSIGKYHNGLHFIQFPTSDADFNILNSDSMNKYRKILKLIHNRKLKEVDELLSDINDLT